MYLVNSYLSSKILDEYEQKIIFDKLKRNFDSEIKIFKFNYTDRTYFEIDFDICDINFSKENIYDDINFLIRVHEEILNEIETDVDIIISNDDTEAEILMYEIDQNDISNFALFISKRVVPNLKPYYSGKCNAYLNLDNASFGVIF